MKVLYIDETKLAEAWPHAAPWLKKAFERGGSDYPIEDLSIDIECGKKRLFRLVHGKSFAWLCVGLMQNSQNRTCNIYAVSGVGVEGFWDEIDKFVCAWAKYNQCQYVNFSGRKGWERAIKHQGWQVASVNYKKEL